MRLAFYINYIARLRESSGGIPDPVLIAAAAEAAGAQAIIAGWTPAAPQLSERDFKLLREMIRGDLVLIAPLGSEYVEAVVKLRPNAVILVAGGWDGVKPPRPVSGDVDGHELSAAAAAYHAVGLGAAVLMPPDAVGLKALARYGFTGAVLDATNFVTARSDAEAQGALDKLSEAAMAGDKFGLAVSVGQGIDYRHAGALAGLRHVSEICCGRAIVYRALLVGIDRAIVEMATALARSN